MKTFLLFMEALARFVFTRRFMHAEILLEQGIRFLSKKVQLRKNPIYCGKCGNKIHVYFMRSSHTMLGYGDEERLFHWFKCSNDACNNAWRLIEGG